MNLSSGRTQELAERILKGDVCDVFTPSAPAVIEKDLMTKKVAGTGRVAATWSVSFSVNEMVVVTAKGNALEIKTMSDLAKNGVRFSRVTGEEDMTAALAFVKFILSDAGRKILEATGKPPIIPPVTKGDLPGS